MASSLDVAVATERLLTHHDREERNRLAAAILANATSLRLEFDPTRIAKGSRLGVDWELFEVWEGSGTGPYTVEGAQAGSTAAGHDEGALVTVNPRFPRHSILAEINNELDDLSSPIHGLFRVTTLDVTYDAGVYGYDLASDFLDVLEVSWEPVGSTKDRRYLRPGEYEVRRGLDVADFASGNAIFLPSGITDGYTVRVRYVGAFTSIVTSTTDVATTSGLPATALDILHLGAAIRLLAPLEPARNYTDAQGNSRRSEEVPPGASDRSMLPLQEIRRDRIRSEAARLRKMYPTVMR